MHLLSCEHPVRVYNKYIDQYLFVPCGKCNSCQNRRAMKWTQACERERSNSLFTLFVTLTYDEYSLPLYNYTGGFDELDKSVYKNASCLFSTRLHDSECMELSDDLFDEDSDKELFYYYLNNKGIPYASKTDIQLFHKRLNKWFYNNVTNKYQNFRFFLVSEYGSTTLRPHYHAIYFVNDNEVAKRFQDGIFASWKYGRYDCQYVENNASSYVAQYINKFYDLPSFYKAKQVRPFFICSRNPIIGNLGKSPQSDAEIVNNATATTLSFSRKDFRYVRTELDSSTENRLFPKCPFYRQVADFVRIELYSISDRFAAQGFFEFTGKIREYLKGKELGFVNDFTSILLNQVDGFSTKGLEWLRRLYYLSRKVVRNARTFGLSLFAYVQKIDDYWKNKELHLINKMYEFQKEYMDNPRLDSDVSDLLFMYLDFLWNNGYALSDFLKQYTPREIINQRKDAAYFAFSNKRSHFKNMYLDSLKVTNNSFYKQLNKFYHAKKRNEIIEALATPCA